jgi:toxin YxiD
MKVLDVNPFQEGLQRNITMLNRLETEMRSIETSIEGLVGLEDSLKGQGGNAIRAFYNDCHLPFLQFFNTFKSSFHSILTQMKSALDVLEPDANGFIRQSFLEGEIESGLTEISQVTSNLTDESNDIMNQVSDIVALPYLDDSGVQDSVNNAKKKRDNTVTDLNEFDSTQNNALDQIESDLLTMNIWLLEIEGMMNDGLSDINFNSGQWADYSKSNPLKTQLDSRLSQMENVDAEGKKVEPGDVSSANPTIMGLKVLQENLLRATTGTIGVSSGYVLYQAGKNKGLTTSQHKDMRRNVYSYRINATGTALNKLGFESDKSGAILKFATQKPDQTGWSKYGDEVLKKHPTLAYWNDQATTAQKAKTIGTATLKGTGEAFTDLVDVKGVTNSGFLKGASKSLGIAGAGLSYYSNYTTAIDEGLSDGNAAGRATVDTAIDVSVAGAIQVGFTAAGTAIIPIPGVGTAVGVLAGIGINALLNTKMGKSKKSAMDHIKGWFH